MARRLTRKQIKQDEFITFFDTVMRWLSENWRRTAMGFGGALLIGLIWWGVSAFVAGRSDAAAASLASALDTYTAPVGSAAPADAKVKFGTDAERLAAAEKAFRRVASSYWHTSQARVAKLYLARIAAERGDRTAAISQLAALTSHRGSGPLVRLAMLDLVELRLAQGEGQQPVPELQAMAAGKDPRLPRDGALFELARALERPGQLAPAGQTHRSPRPARPGRASVAPPSPSA